MFGTIYTQELLKLPIAEVFVSSLSIASGVSYRVKMYFFRNPITPLASLVGNAAASNNLDI